MLRLLLWKSIMMEQPIRVAVIGCGWAGALHADAYERCGATVELVVDQDLGRAETLATSRQRTRVATDYQEVLSDPDVGAISICLSHSLHAQVAVDAATKGKHVLCEKPLATSLEEADRMIEAAEQNHTDTKYGLLLPASTQALCYLYIAYQGNIT